MIGAWFVAFVITCSVELVILRVLAPRRHWLPVGFAAQLATHPLAVTLMVTLPGLPLLRLAAIELGVTLAEAAIYARWLRLPRSEALRVAALANAGSLIAAALL